jgi:RRXRR protein/HNH endonuclease
MVYVINRYGAPLMPCGERKARLLLKAGKARVMHRTPFTIALLFGASGYRQEVIAALDTGSSVVGSAAIAHGQVVYQAEVTLRSDISGKVQTRSDYRRTRRRRKTRYRSARFDNRCASRRKGRLPPSLKSKVEGHLREVRFVESILPVRQWNFELAAFDIHRITNPEVTGAGYQQGALKDYYNVKQFVLAQDGYACQSGQKGAHSKALHVHHVVFRSQGGGDTPANLTTLCKTCHEALHAGHFTLTKKGKRSKTKHATHMGVIKSRLSQLGQSIVPHRETFGYETKFKREQCLKWPKTHANDAVAACLEDGEVVLPMARILIKNHMASGDYQQTAGKHSQQRMPTGKLFGLRKGDKVATPRGVGFIKGKRSTGYFAIADLDSTVIHASEKAANCIRLAARKTTQVESHTVADLILRRKVRKIRVQAEKETKKAKKTKNSAAQPLALYLPGLNPGVSRAP